MIIIKMWLRLEILIKRIRIAWLQFRGWILRKQLMIDRAAAERREKGSITGKRIKEIEEEIKELVKKEL